MIQTVVIAANPTIRAGLEAMLNQNKEIEVSINTISVSQLGEIPPGTDIVLLVPEPGSLSELESLLGRLEIPPALLILNQDAIDLQDFSELALRAWGILPLDASPEELNAAVLALHEGLLVASPELIQPLLGVEISTDAQESFLVEELTPRELEVLQLIAEGLANKQIALELEISEHTVKFHVSSVYSKLGAGSRTEAVRLGARLGLIVL